MTQPELVNTLPETPAQQIKPKPMALWSLAMKFLRLMAPQRGGLIICVAIPTLFTALYQSFIAADIYVSESAFSVRMEQSQANNFNSAGIAITGLQMSPGIQDQLALNTYIHSQAMVNQLEETIGLRKMFRHANADILTRLDDHTTDEALLGYYRDMVTIRYDDRSQISTIEARGFTAEDAYRLNKAILTSAETFVNQLSASIRQDSIAFAREQATLAETELAKASNVLSNFREENRNFDPAKTSEGIASIMLTLQAQLAEKRATLQAARGTLTEHNPQIRMLEREIAALESQIGNQSDQLTSSASGSVGSKLEDYTTLALRHEFALKRYELALTSLEAAQTEAGRKSIYLSRVVPAVKPDEAIEPRRLYIIFSVLFLTLAAYGMALLFTASIYDHIRK